MYLIIDDASQEAAVVDPYDATKISNAVKEKGVDVSLKSDFRAIDSLKLEVKTLITTHHHDDHCGGNRKFVCHFR